MSTEITPEETPAVETGTYVPTENTEGLYYKYRMQFKNAQEQYRQFSYNISKGNDSIANLTKKSLDYFADGTAVTFESMLCFVGAQNLNIYGLGDSTVIRSIGGAGPRDCPIFASIGSDRNDLSQLSMTPYYRISPGVVLVESGPGNIRNMKMIYNSSGRSSYAASLSRALGTGTILKNINFEITGAYTLQYDNSGGAIYYQNCTFTGGNRQGNYSGASIITTAPDNEIDTLIKNPSLQPKTGNNISSTKTKIQTNLHINTISF